MSRYRAYRRAANAAARIGNHTAALEFAGKAEAEQWVMPADWSPRACFARGIELRGADLDNVATWRTKSEAREAARGVNWPAGEVTKVHHRLHGQRWALVDGRFGLVSRSWYAAMKSRS